MTLRSLPERVLALLRKDRFNGELDEEIRTHIEMAAEENIRRGMSPDEARRAARCEFGGVEQMKEEYRDLGWLRGMEACLQDLRYAARRLRRSPGFTVMALLILALGLGANTAIFSVINAVLLRPLPFPEPDRLVGVWEETPMFGLHYSPPAMGNYVDWREQNQVFEEMGALENWTYRLTAGVPEEVPGSVVTSSLFRVLGVEPHLGRYFAEGEDMPGAPRAVVISYGLWQRRFAGQPGAIGSETMIDDAPYTIIGVMPPNFHFPSSETELWMPYGSSFPIEGWSDRGRHNLMVVARLEPGVTVGQAGENMKSIAAQQAREYPQTNAGVGAFVAPLRDSYVAGVRPLYGLLLGTVGLVLLIACANLANLMLTRAAHRQREIAVRTALGASGFHIGRQMLAESVLITIGGGVLGLLVAVSTFGFLRHLVPAELAAVASLGLDYRVLAFALAACLVTALVCGIVPVAPSLRIDVSHALKEGSARAGTGRSTHRLRSALVASQVALSLVLLIGAVLLVRTFASLRGVDPGFRSDNVLTMRVSPSTTKYADMQTRMNLYRQVLDRVQSLPGVVSAGFTTGVPLAFKGWQNAVQAEGMPEPSPGESPMVNFRVVTPGYRKTLGIPLLRGRDLEESDGPDAPPVALVNEAMARMLWPGQDPLGKRYRHGGWALEDYPWITVAGLVGDIKQNGLDVPARPEMYLSYQQSGNTPRVLAVRTRQDPSGLAEAIRQAILSVDPGQPVSDVATMETILDRETFQRHLQAILLAAFAGLAVLVAAFGVYGVISYMVEQNRHEFGVRMALGARPAQVLSNVIGSGLRMTAGGVILGLIAALGFTRLLSHVLFGIGPWDVPTYAGVSIVLMVAAVLATLIPAVRATRVDPLAALREE